MRRKQTYKYHFCVGKIFAKLLHLCGLFQGDQVPQGLARKDVQVNAVHQVCLVCMAREDHQGHKENRAIVNIVTLPHRAVHKLFVYLMVIQEEIQSRDLRNINLLSSLLKCDNSVATDITDKPVRDKSWRMYHDHDIDQNKVFTFHLSTNYCHFR